MAINLVPFDTNRTMSESRVSRPQEGPDQPQAVVPVQNKREARKEFEEHHKIESKASKPNRRKRKEKKSVEMQDDYGLYTNRQTEDHHLVQEYLEEPAHKLDIEV